MEHSTTCDKSSYPPRDDAIRPKEAVILKPGDDPWQQEGGETSLLLTGQGAFVVRREAFYRWAVPALTEDFEAVFGETGRELKGFGPKGGAVQLKYPIPARILFQAVAFFRDAWRTYETEDILYLLFYFQRPEYTLVHPVLTSASQGHVRCERPAAPAGAVIFGTVHSHPPWAYVAHSEIDDADVAGIPGLHIVIGHLAQGLPTLACCLATSDGRTFSVPPHAVFEGTPSGADAYPKEWLERPGGLPKRPPRASSPDS